jgi:K+-transporting ATPase c subunit
VKAELAKATDNPFLGIGGESGVNVLMLNLALDALPKNSLSSGTPTSK